MATANRMTVGHTHAVAMQSSRKPESRRLSEGLGRTVRPTGSQRDGPVVLDGGAAKGDTCGGVPGENTRPSSSCESTVTSRLSRKSAAIATAPSTAPIAGMLCWSSRRLAGPDMSQPRKSSAANPATMMRRAR